MKIIPYLTSSPLYSLIYFVPHFPFLLDTKWIKMLDFKKIKVDGNTYFLLELEGAFLTGFWPLPLFLLFLLPLPPPFLPDPSFIQSSGVSHVLHCIVHNIKWNKVLKICNTTIWFFNGILNVGNSPDSVSVVFNFALFLDSGPNSCCMILFW